MVELQARLSQDERRNSFILDDAVASIRDGRSPLLLCQRRQHVEWFAQRLERYAPHLFVLMGGETTRLRNEKLAALKNLPAREQHVIVATGSFIGEGFDDPGLDTLLLAAPISWKGMLAQYVGRLHRQNAGKEAVWVFDYVDANVPELDKMFTKRVSGYRALGYTESQPPNDFELLGDPSLDGDLYWEDADLVHGQGA